MTSLAATEALTPILDTLTPEQLDGLPYGMIQLDRDGRILRYNRAEGELTGRSAAEQLGKHFFDEVAPCTKVREFHGRFVEGMKRKRLDTTFQFTFALARGPRAVNIRMYYSTRTDTVWVMVADHAAG
jgi:photoactive yellow protein